MTEHDDELADFGGIADVALIAVTVAAHIAAIALLHRSARRMTKRTPAREAARLVATRLGRRGDAALAHKLERAVSRVGTAAFDSTLRAAARGAAARIRAVPERQLVAVLGRKGASEVLELGERACLSGGSLRSEDVSALAAHLDNGAELVVGIGRGAVFARADEPAHKVIDIELDRVPDPSTTSTVRARKLRRRGEAANESDVPATLVIRAHAGATELRISRDGRDVGGELVLDGRKQRMRVIVRGTSIEIAPLPLDPAVEANAAAMLDWAALHQAVQRDELLAELVGELYGHAGFGGTAEILAALLDLAPLIHRSPDIARRVARETPPIIHDPMTEVVATLRAALEAADADHGN